MNVPYECSRRGFLVDLTKSGAAGLCAAACAALPGLGTPRVHGAEAEPRFEVGTARLESFTPFVGERFMVRQMDGRKASLFLASGEEYRPREHESPRGNRIRQPFSLQFEGFSREPLQQGTYDVEHRSLGRFAIFLVPIGVPSTKPTYQAIFG